MNPGASLANKESSKVTERIKATLELLEKHPEGLRWTDLRKMIEASDSTFHPKTVNGCVLPSIGSSTNHAVVAKNFLGGS
jgi:hypothetical protein